MSVLDRSALEASPLADLHAIASELGLDGFRRLRKADLIDAIVVRAGVSLDEAEAEAETETETETAVRGPRSARSVRSGPAAGAARAVDVGADARGRPRPRRAPRRTPTGPMRRRSAAAPSARSASPRAPSRCSATAPASSASTPDEPSDERRLHLRRPGAPLRPRHRRRRRRPGPPPAPLRALPLAGARRDDQRRARRGGRRGTPLRRPARDVPDRAARLSPRNRRPSRRSPTLAPIGRARA